MIPYKHDSEENSEGTLSEEQKTWLQTEFQATGTSAVVGVQEIRVQIPHGAVSVKDDENNLWFRDSNGNLVHPDGRTITRPKEDGVADAVKSWLQVKEHELRGRLRGPYDRIVSVWIPGTSQWAKMPFSSVRKGMTLCFQEDRERGFYLTENVREVYAYTHGQTRNMPSFTIDNGAVPVEIDRATNRPKMDAPDSVTPKDGKMEPPRALYIPPVLKFENCVRPRNSKDDVSEVEAMLYEWYPKTHQAMEPFMAMVHEAFSKGITEAFEIEEDNARIEIIKKHVSQVPVPDCYDVTNIMLEQAATVMTVEFKSNDEARKAHNHQLVVYRHQVQLASYAVGYAVVSEPTSSTTCLGKPTSVLTINAEYFEEDE